MVCFFFSSRRRHTRWTGDWSSDVCSSDLGDVGGHEVGGELNALKFQVEDFGEGLDEERLGETRRAGDEAVAAGEEGDEQLLDDLLLADDDLGEVGLDAGATGDDLFNGLPFGGNLAGCVFHNI